MTSNARHDGSDSPGPGKDQTSAKASHSTRIVTLDELIGGHARALEDIYVAGEPADPALFTAECPGRLLSVTAFQTVFSATRPLVSGFARHLTLWRGKRFESGGTAGTNLVAGKRRFPFHCSRRPLTHRRRANAHPRLRGPRQSVARAHLHRRTAAGGRERSDRPRLHGRRHRARLLVGPFRALNAPRASASHKACHRDERWVSASTAMSALYYRGQARRAPARRSRAQLRSKARDER